MDDESKRLVSRGGLKLEAALDLFDLSEAVRGTQAVDVGASTGGFTQVLLERGARDVVAVDTGHGQLHEKLRGDPRVRNLEGTDWKRLSLSEAAGPFDFFTVDVSFVAARNMLRGLAFRLREGARGVVLVKPQFELPDRLVRAGNVTDPGLRRQALEKFTAKAESLGFRVLGHRDSPVAGGEGTIEILTHLLFEGRSEKLPQPGERRPHKTPAPPARSSRVPGARGRVAPSGASAALARQFDWFAVVAPGAEQVAAREAIALLGPGASATAVHGGVEFRGPFLAGMRANLHLRIPTRVLLRLGTLRAREFGKLRHLLARLPWESFVSPGAPLKISVSTSHCRLYHTGAVEEAARAAIGDRTGAAPPKAVAADGEGALILVRGVDDSWTVSVDSSGARLHKRGWRTEGGEAPLRESLAAAVLALAEWQPDEALVDPMCGAGTISIEACMMALRIAAGSKRSFAFEGWPACDGAVREAWENALHAAEGTMRHTAPGSNVGPALPPIVASDRDAAAVAATRQNAARAGVETHLTILQRPLSDVEAPAAAGLFVANPPYGERLGNRRELPALYREIGLVLRRGFVGWRAAVVVPDVRLASAFRLPIVATHPLIHGGLRVSLVRLGPIEMGGRPSASTPRRIGDVRRADEVSPEPTARHPDD